MARKDNLWVSKWFEVHVDNAYRSKHRAPPLKWSEECAEEARKTAKHYASSTQGLHHTNIQVSSFLA